jgi:hypothetical protein
MNYKTEDQVVVPDVVDVIRSFHDGCLTVTQVVKVLMAWDVHLHEIKGNKYTVSCYTDEQNWLNQKLEDFDVFAPNCPPEFVVEV